MPRRNKRAGRTPHTYLDMPPLPLPLGRRASHDESSERLSHDGGHRRSTDARDQHVTSTGEGQQIQGVQGGGQIVNPHARKPVVAIRFSSASGAR